ncbi:MAK10-like protein [Tanacetum coccineum]
MGDEIPCRTLGYYSRPSLEGYRNTIELPDGNNVVPLQSDTIRLVQNGCSFHRLWSEDPNQHLKDFLKILDSHDLNVDNRERTRLGPHDTQDYMENPEQAFVEYASTRTDEAGDAKISNFEADFKQYQSEVTNKLDTLLNAFNDQMTGVLPSDTVKNPKSNPNSSSCARSYPTGDPESSSNSFKSVNAIQTCFKSSTNIQKDQLQVNTLTANEIETPTTRETKNTLEDEFAYLHLNLLVLEVLAHVLIYDALLDKYIVSLELGKNRSEYIQSVAPEKMKDPGLFILPCRLGDSKPFETLVDLGSCVNSHPLKLFKKLKIGLLEETDDALGLADGTKPYPVGIVKNVEVHEEDFSQPAIAVIDCKKAKIAVGERLTRSIFGVRELDFGEDNVPCWTTIGKRESYNPQTSEDGISAQPPYYAKRDFWYNHLPEEWAIARDAEVYPFKDVFVFRKMVEFLAAIPINLKGNIWESKDLVEDTID